MQLDKAGAQSSDLNKEGYISDLNNVKVKSDVEINDLKKAR